jgi:ribosome biogenesis GTPase A
MRLRLRVACWREGATAVFTNALADRHVSRVINAISVLPRAGAAFKYTGTLVLVAGLPNVGKSSLINAFKRLAGDTLQARVAAVSPCFAQ